jgi:glycosyltransferase involved in cell wall biosynthesis
MKFSIVIPTRNRPEQLARCVAAARAQDAGGLELVVVDDGSRDRGAIAAAAADVARVIRSTGVGPAAARNLGARAASGEVICFLDDDCEPLPGWAAALADAATGGAAAGRTLAPPDAGRAVIASQAIVEHLTLASLDPVTARLGFAPSCNLAVTREALRLLPFDGSFPGAAGEDRDWSARARAAGLAPVYCPDAVVVHHQRLGAPGFIRQQFRYGRGAALFRARAGDRRLAPPHFYAGLLRHGFEHGAATGALVLAAQGLTAAGAAAERLGL